MRLATFAAKHNFELEEAARLLEGMEEEGWDTAYWLHNADDDSSEPGAALFRKGDTYKIAAVWALKEQNGLVVSEAELKTLIKLNRNHA